MDSEEGEDEEAEARPRGDRDRVETVRRGRDARVPREGVAEEETLAVEKVALPRAAA